MSRGCRWLKDRCSRTASCASVCTRIFLVVINFFFLLSGWALFGVGVWMHVYKETFFYSALFKDNPTGPMVVVDKVSLILIGVGGFVVTVCFLGCCGACTDSVCFLAFYALLLVIAILLQICVASLAPTFRQQILSNLAISMQYQIRYEYNATALPSNRTAAETLKLTTAWDTLQIKLNCCGADGPIDYRDSSWFNHTHYTDGTFVPPACCVLPKDDTTLVNLNDGIEAAETMCQIDAIAVISNYPNRTFLSSIDHVNAQGCHTAIADWFNQHEYIVGILSVVIMLQIVDFIYACILMSWLRKALTDYAWCEDEEF